MVVIALVPIDATRVTQERAAAPSSSTVHAPHCPSPQPYLLPVSPKSPRRIASRLSPGSASTSRLVPLTRSTYRIQPILEHKGAIIRPHGGTDEALVEGNPGGRGGGFARDRRAGGAGRRRDGEGARHS